MSPISKVLIVGGAGYIGSHVNKLLSRNGYKTVVFDNLSSGHRRMVCWGDFFRGDLASPANLAHCFKKHRISTVMHFGAFAYVGESVSTPAKYYQNSVANTLNLLAAMRTAGVDKLVFSSSCSVYGVPTSLPMRETMPFRPISPYGRTKVMVEEILADYAAAYGLKYAALRYFNAAGADPGAEIGEVHRPETHLIPLVLDVAAGRRKAIKVFGGDYATLDGTCIRDYIHVEDLASAHLLALRYLEFGGGSCGFNLGNGKGFSVLEIIRTAERVSGKRIRIKMAPRREGAPSALVASSILARKVLGWKPQYVALETIIAHAWQWHKKKLQSKVL